MVPERAILSGVPGVKRVVDCFGAALGLIVLAPLFLLVASAVWLTMGRPVLFTQRRPGRYGQPFTIYKFRTMVPPEVGEVWFRSDQRRLTVLGRWLRRTSLDELPELWNVLRGDMSLVGPRPLLMEYLDKYTTDEQRRHTVLPGITGWAQVNGRQAIAFSQRLQLDLWYVDHWSLALDLKILLKTISLATLGRGVVPGQPLDDVDDLGLSADRNRRSSHGAGATRQPHSHHTGPE